MKLFELTSGPLGTNAYLLVHEERKEALLIDAPVDLWEELQLILLDYQVKLIAILITHAHWDHIAEAAEIAKQTAALVYASKSEQLLLDKPAVMTSSMPAGLEIPPVKVAHWFADKPETLELAGHNIEVLPVPGHSPGNVAFYFKDLRSVFTGDALFADSVGRTDLPGSSFKQLEQSIRAQLYTLPEETLVYPGHGPATTIGNEKKGNPFIKAL